MLPTVGNGTRRGILISRRRGERLQCDGCTVVVYIKSGSGDRDKLISWLVVTSHGIFRIFAQNVFDPDSISRRRSYYRIPDNF
jgi:hypothetical protein